MKGDDLWTKGRGGLIGVDRKHALIREGRGVDIQRDKVKKKNLHLCEQYTSEISINTKE